MASKTGSHNDGKGLKDVWILLLCGLPGSGKTTLRKRLVENGWSYVSQDEMVTADACEKALVKSMKLGSSCIVDRCNVTSSDRRLWMQHANRAVEKGSVKGVRLHFEAVWMATPTEVCKQRARARVAHETLSPEAADAVIDSFCRGMRPPERSGQEPYEGVHSVVSDEDVELVVRRFRDGRSIDTSVCIQPKPLAAAFNDFPDESPNSLFESRQQQQSPERQGDNSVELFILRHGERADRAKGRDGGWPDDTPLTADGRQTAKQAGVALRSLATLPWAAVYSSPFYRCLQTANEVAAELGLPVRVEPGLSELCCARIFNRQPELRAPQDALTEALIRVANDCSVPPVNETLPTWPEEGRDANTRIVDTARTILGRHPGQAVCLVCHSHSLIEITRRVPSSGGGAVGSRSGYCGMSRISSGVLMECLDQSYLKGAEDTERGMGDAFTVPEPTGYWDAGWQWQSLPLSDAHQDTDAEALLDLEFEVALERFPRFKDLWDRGTLEKREALRAGWGVRSPDVLRKVREGHAAGLFKVL